MSNNEYTFIKLEEEISSKRRIISVLLLSTLFCLLFFQKRAKADYADCTINLTEELYGSKTTENLSKNYYNFISLKNKNNENSNDYALFKILTTKKLKTLDSKWSELYSCGFSDSKVIVCESDRIISHGSCTKRDVKNCSSWDSFVSGENNNSSFIPNLNKPTCYPEQHICNRYKEYNTINTKFYAVDDEDYTIYNEDNKKHSFVIYYKDIRYAEEDAVYDSSRNCRLKRYTCDLKVGSSDSSGVNIVTEQSSGVNDENFRRIIKSDLPSNVAFFQYKGSCALNDCKSVLVDGERINILTNNAYFKYKYTEKTSSGNNVVRVDYYIKNIQRATCDKYLPPCKEIPLVNRRPLISNTNTRNNNRANYYKSKTSNIKDFDEAYLQYLSNNGNTANCLYYDEPNQESSADVSYCSDLDASGNFKYNTFSTKNVSVSNVTLKIPNCFLKSCADLTSEELRAISNEGGSKIKRCSEYRWLSNDAKLKYFPKEFPIYCSDLNNGSLIFTSGLSPKKDNCYLKTCFSLSEKEREAVATQKILDFAKATSGYTGKNGLDSIIQTDLNLPKYCENKVFYIRGLNHINLNTVPCTELKSSVSSNIQTDAKSLWFNSYDSWTSRAVCRKQITPIYRNIGTDKSFLCNVKTTINENSGSSGGDSNSQYFENVCDDNHQNKYISNKGFAHNVCKYVDNFTLYLNAEVPLKIPASIGSLDEKTKGEKNKELGLNQNPNSEYNGSMLGDVDISNIFTAICGHNNLPNVRSAKLGKALSSECSQVDTAHVSGEIKEFIQNFAKDNPGCSANCDSEGKNCSYDPAYCDQKQQLILSVKLCQSNHKKYIIDTICSESEIINGPSDSNSLLRQCTSQENECPEILLSKYFENNCQVYNNGLGFASETDPSYYDCGLYYNEDIKALVKETSPLYDTIKSNIKYCNAEVYQIETPMVSEPSPTFNSQYLPALNNGKISNVGRGRFDIMTPLCGVNEKDEGCFTPDSNTAYISKIGQSYAKTDTNSNIKPKDATVDISVCTRFGKSNQCGAAEHGDIGDYCLPTKLQPGTKDNAQAVGINFANFESYKMSPNLGFRYEVERVGRRVCTFLSKESSLCSFENKENYTFPEVLDTYCDKRFAAEFFLKTACRKALEGEVGTAKAYLITTHAVLIAAVAAATIACFFTAGGALAALIVATAALAAYETYSALLGSPLTTYSRPSYDKPSSPCVYSEKKDFSEYNINVRNDTNTVRDYGNDKKGIITELNIHDNNNTDYAFYNRKDNFLSDVRSKTSGSLQNSKSRDLLSSCGLLGIVNVSQGGLKIDYKSITQDKLDCLKKNSTYFIDYDGETIEGSYNSTSAFLDHKDDTFYTVENNSCGCYIQDNRIKNDYEDYEKANYIKIATVPYVGNLNSSSDINCRLDSYGNPIGNIEYCRGIYDPVSKIFYKETQCVPIRLETSPQAFFTLANQNNSIDLFSPLFYLSAFYSYKNNQLKIPYNNQEVILDFFNPKMHFNYEYKTIDSRYINAYSGSNEAQLAAISNNSDKSFYEYKYEGQNLAAEFKKLEVFDILLRKDSYTDIRNLELPTVCIDRIQEVPQTFEQYTLEMNGKHYITLEDNIMCYDRYYPPFRNIFLRIDSEKFHFNTPVVQAAIVDRQGLSNNSILSKFSDASYQLRDKVSDSIYINETGRNGIQHFSLKFDRSYCSKRVVEYYQNLDKIAREKIKSKANQDLSLIANLQRQNDSITETVFSYCEHLDGDLIEFAKYEDINNGYVENIHTTRQNPGAFGAFNDICISEEHFDAMKAKNRELGDNIPEVLAYVTKQGAKGKCVLDDISRSNIDCLVDDIVYAYCDDINEIGCKKVASLGTAETLFVKEVNCSTFFNEIRNKPTLEVIKNEEYIKKMQLCYKGGFNKNNTVFSDDRMNYSCSCYDDTTGIRNARKDNASLFNKYFESRDAERRELGLCVSIPEIPTCRAVKYYGHNHKYIDPNEQLYFTTEEELNSLRGTNNPYEQNIWRSEEKIFGVMNSASRSDKTQLSLGHAEFESSLYCGDNISKCIGAQDVVEGTCNGFWRNSDHGTPRAKCVKKKIGNKYVYQYELLENSQVCERYACPDVFIDSGDESEIYNFDAAEISNFTSTVAPTDFKSFSHNEEIDGQSVDLRGNSHGFAVWSSIESKDIAQPAVAKQCITGFAPAGTNYYKERYIPYIFTDSNSADVDVNYEYLAGTRVEQNKFVKLLKEQVRIFNEELLTNGLNITGLQLNAYLPRRYCGPRGEWLVVRDIYHNAITNTALHYFREHPVWQNAVTGANNGNGFLNLNFIVDKDTGFLQDNVREVFEPAVEKNLYCERLYCPRINFEDSFDTYDDKMQYSIYVSETKPSIDETLPSGTTRHGKYYITSDPKIINKYTPWRHTGGARWEAISAPRNDSSKVIYDVNDYTSASIIRIFDIKSQEDQSIDSSTSYLKKVQGECAADLGYYSRGTYFLDTFIDQHSQLQFTSSVTDPRMFGLIDEVASADAEKPSRTCNSAGIWSGVNNPCFRACEMMDLYHTNFKRKINDGDYISNQDISTIRSTPDYDRFHDYSSTDKESVIIANKETSGFLYGDYRLGGARWPRSIVNENSLTLETTGPKKGLRYYEVEGECDATYPVKGSETEVYQYVINKKTKNPPKRRCYEDGTWGPVQGDTRCVLFRTCGDLYFRLEDLKSLITIYNKDKSNAYNLALNLNTDLNRIMVKNAGSILGFSYLSAGNKSDITDYSGSEFNVTLQNIADSQAKATTFEKAKEQFVCNLSRSINKPKVDFWNFNAIDYDIGNYFIPKTCTNENVFQNNTELSQLFNRLKIKRLALPMYVKESGLADITSNSETMNIGTKEYGRYYVDSVQCDNTLFYTSDAKSTVGYKCTLGSGGAPTFSIITDADANASTLYNNYGHHVHPSDCLMKTCGNNSYQKNFSKSGITEVLDQVGTYNYNTLQQKYKSASAINFSYSEFSCPSGYALVLPADELNRLRNVKTVSGASVLVGYDSGSKNYLDHGFVQKIRADCRVNQSTNKINNTSTSDRSIEYYGALDQSQFPTKLCTDLERKSCVSVSEQTVANDSSFSTNYCVYMGCTAGTYNIKNNVGQNVSSLNSVYINKYPFDKIVIFESSSGDFLQKAGMTDNGYVIQQNNLCNSASSNSDASSDIYSTGTSTPDSFEDYFYSNSQYSVCDSYISRLVASPYVKFDTPLAIWATSFNSARSITLTSAEKTNLQTEVKKHLVDVVLDSQVVKDEVEASVQEDLQVEVLKYIKTQVNKSVYDSDIEVVCTKGAGIDYKSEGYTAYSCKYTIPDKVIPEPIEPEPSEPQPEEDADDADVSQDFVEDQQVPVEPIEEIPTIMLVEDSFVCDPIITCNNQEEIEGAPVLSTDIGANQTNNDNTGESLGTELSGLNGEHDEENQPSEGGENVEEPIQPKECPEENKVTDLCHKAYFVTEADLAAFKQQKAEELRQAKMAVIEAQISGNNTILIQRLKAADFRLAESSSYDYNSIIQYYEKLWRANKFYQNNKTNYVNFINNKYYSYSTSGLMSGLKSKPSSVGGVSMEFLAADSQGYSPLPSSTANGFLYVCAGIQSPDINSDTSVVVSENNSICLKVNLSDKIPDLLRLSEVCTKVKEVNNSAEDTNREIQSCKSAKLVDTSIEPIIEYLYSYVDKIYMTIQDKVASATNYSAMYQKCMVDLPGGYRTYLANAGTSVTGYNTALQQTPREGFYMAVQCNTKGFWEAVTESKCVRRCSGTATVRVDPYGWGTWNLTFNVSGLRYREKFNRYRFYAHSQLCFVWLDGDGGEVKSGYISGNCGNNGSISLSTDVWDVGDHFGKPNKGCGTRIDCSGVGSEDFRYGGLAWEDNHKPAVMLCQGPGGYTYADSSTSATAVGFSGAPYLKIKTTVKSTESKQKQTAYRQGPYIYFSYD